MQLFMNDLDISLDLVDVNYINAFNGAIINYDKNRFICTYQDNINQGLSFCFLDFIDGRYHYVNDSTTLIGTIGLTDSRLVKFGNNFFISSTDFTKPIQTINLVKLIIAENKIFIDYDTCYNFYNIENFYNYTPRTEKNWSPFEHDGKLYYIYSLNPHRILEVDIYGNGKASLKYETTWYTNSWWNYQNWGEPAFRLNSPPILLEDGTYLSTFHTMKFSETTANNLIRSYWTGFYQFEATPPFRVKKISSKPVFYPNYMLPDRWPEREMIITENPFFPFSMFINQNNLHLFGGTNDIALASGTLNLEKVINSLENVVNFSVNY